mmetsp:Transcript_9590/g.31362  ORF Transcript_9590/g.31362 Transcript_9590/m.31362 type:complete len:226 (-) Transcript_9590:691-1368(-)
MRVVNVDFGGRQRDLATRNTCVSHAARALSLAGGMRWYTPSPSASTMFANRPSPSLFTTPTLRSLAMSSLANATASRSISAYPFPPPAVSASTDRTGSPPSGMSSVPSRTGCCPSAALRAETRPPIRVVVPSSTLCSARWRLPKQRIGPSCCTTDSNAIRRGSSRSAALTPSTDGAMGPSMANLPSHSLMAATSMCFRSRCTSTRPMSDTVMLPQPTVTVVNRLS